MKIKKVMALLLVVAMCMSMAACGKKQETEPAKEEKPQATELVIDDKKEDEKTDKEDQKPAADEKTDKEDQKTDAKDDKTADDSSNTSDPAETVADDTSAEEGGHDPIPEEPSRIENSTFVDRQGTSDVYSSLTITQNGSIYDCEMSLYRLAVLEGTVGYLNGHYYYTDNERGVFGELEFVDAGVNFVVQSSEWDYIEAGETFSFPEKQ